MNNPLDQEPTALPTPIVSSSTPRISSEALLQGAKELLIEHGTQTYRLRQTRSGKLILQK